MLPLMKLPRMSTDEIDKLINSQILCRIAFGGKIAPYVAPFQYVSINNELYFHFTNYGKKMSFLEEGQPVCVEIEKYQQDLSEYKFVVLTGKLRIVSNPKERSRAIEKIVSTAKAKNLSENFLLAHGFPKEKGWDYLSPEKPILIVKLEVNQKNGLMSP